VLEQIAVETIAGSVVAVVTLVLSAGLRAGGGGWEGCEVAVPAGDRAADLAATGSRDVTQVVDQSEHHTHIQAAAVDASSEHGWGQVVATAAGGVVAVVLLVAFAEHVVALTTFAAVGLAAGGALRAVRSRRRVGPFDEARWVALGHVVLGLAGVALALRGSTALERDGVSVAAVQEAVRSTGPFEPTFSSSVNVLLELGRPAWEVCASAAGGVVLAWLLVSVGVVQLRSWAVADRGIRHRPSSSAVRRRFEAFGAQRAVRLLWAVGLVAITWMVVRGDVADAIGWLSGSGSGMSP
jgi:hypothetical protein